MWIALAILMFLWFVLKFVAHKGGYVHMLLVAAIAIFVVQMIAQRKTAYHQNSDE